MGRYSEKEIDVKELYGVIKKRFWIVLVVTLVLSSLGAFYVSLPRTNLYEASTRVYLQASKELYSTVKVIMREPVVLQHVAEQLKLNRSAEALRGQISINDIDNSTVLRIRVVDADPVLAAQIANEVVTSYQSVSRGTVFSSSIIVLTEAEAKVNPTPINPKSYKMLYLSIVIGLVMGVGMVFVIDSLDDTVKSDREVEQFLGLALLGNVSRIKKQERLKKMSRNLPQRGEAIGS